MKYYVTTDVHGFYSELRQALTEAGFFSDEEPHKLIILGDLFDRGREAKLLQQFVLDLMEKGEVILIRGNHEDLFVDMVTSGDGIQLRHHVINGTYNTAVGMILQILTYVRHFKPSFKAEEKPRSVLNRRNDYTAQSCSVSRK